MRFSFHLISGIVLSLSCLFSTAFSQTNTASYSQFSNLTQQSSNIHTVDGNLSGVGGFDVTITRNSGIYFPGEPAIRDFPPLSFIDGAGWTNAGTASDASLGVANNDGSTVDATLEFDFSAAPLPVGHDFFVAGQRDSTIDLIFLDSLGDPLDVSGTNWEPILGNYSATFPGDDLPIWTGGVTGGSLAPGAFSATGNGTIAAWDLPEPVFGIQARYRGSIDQSDLSRDLVLFSFGAPSAVPEPSSLGFLMLGTILATRRRRK